MPNLKLTYFDFKGGRAEPARLALEIGEIEYEDIRFTFDQFAEIKKGTPLHQVPVLEIDGKSITQCNAINRYVAKLADLYPYDDFQALLCDETMDAVEDLTHKLVMTFGLEGEELKAAREKFINERLIDSLKWAQSKLEAAGGEFFADNRLTIADLKVLVWILGLNSGHLDHIPTTLVQEVAPKLNQHCQQMMQIPAIARHFA